MKELFLAKGIIMLIAGLALTAAGAATVINALNSAEQPATGFAGLALILIGVSLAIKGR